MELKKLYQKIDQYKEAINHIRPIKADELKLLQEYYRIGLTYASNAIEGNTLTLSETKILLEDGLTVGGKPIQDYYEASGHSDAYTFMWQLTHENGYIPKEEDILELHRLFYHKVNETEAGKYRGVQNFITGTEFVPPEPEKVSGLMKQYIKKIGELKNIVHPIELASWAHKGLVDIHPFVDGNGRTARLLMNAMLISNGYNVVTIPPVIRNDYVQALMASQRLQGATNQPFFELIAECVLESEKDYCRMFHISQEQIKNSMREIIPEQ